MSTLINPNNVLLEDWIKFKYHDKQRHGQVIDKRGSLLTLKRGSVIKKFRMEKIQGPISLDH